MKVLHVSSAYEPGYGYGGPVRSVGSLCRALVRSGAEVTVFTTNANGVGPAHLDVPLAHPVDRDGVEVYYFPRHWPWSLYRAPKLRDACHARIGEFDIVHIAGLWAYPARVAGMESMRQGVPFVVSPRGMLMPWESRHKSWKKRPYYYFSEGKRLRESTALHCTTDAERNALAAFGLKAKAFVIPNGVDVSEFDALPERGSLRKRLRIPRQDRVILYLGRLHHKKGIELTLASFYRLAQSQPGVHLVIAGVDEGGYVASIQTQAAAWSLDDRIHVTGELTGRDRLSAYADADAFVLLSESENFGMSVSEALACRVPVVISKDVGISAWILAAEAGVVVDRQLEAVACALTEVLCRGRDVQQMTENGRRLVEHELSEDAVGTRMLETYRGLMK